VWKIKYNADGTIACYKARLITQGNTEIQEVDYEEVFSPITYITSIHILLSITHKLGHNIYQMDVDTAYLYGKLTKNVYMKQPQRYKDSMQPNKTLLLRRGIYSLHKSGKVWNTELDSRFKALGYTVFAHIEPCIYFMKEVDS
jgi:hypothetical protein